MKNLISVCLILTISTSVAALNCEDVLGSPLKTNNGTVYCMSKNRMNWWTALGWCQTIGKRMFHYPDDCFCIGDTCPTTGTQCPNLKGLGGMIGIWSDTPKEASSAYAIALNSGNFDGYANRDFNHFALCY